MPDTTVEWEKTSFPVAIEDKRFNKWRLRLQYTQSKKKTQRVFSEYFGTEDETNASASWWRTSWEQGHKGKRINPQTDPDQVSMDAADLPQGKSLNSMARLNAAQERQFKRQRREGSDLSRSEWMKSTCSKN